VSILAAALACFTNACADEHAIGVITAGGHEGTIGTIAVKRTGSAARGAGVPYMIQVDAAVLSRSGVPSRNVLVPAAMGTSRQLASNQTADGQAEKRRSVVTLLQNKGVTAR
jgi:hypothetical protein